MLRVVRMIRKSVLDGKPCDGKLSCTVWDGGKGGDNTKTLPIVIELAAIHIFDTCLRCCRGYFFRTSKPPRHGNRVMGLHFGRSSVRRDGIYHLPRHDGGTIRMDMD